MAVVLLFAVFEVLGERAAVFAVGRVGRLVDRRLCSAFMAV